MPDKPENTITNPVETMRDAMAALGRHDAILTPEELDLSRAYMITVPDSRRIENLTPYIRAAAEYLKPARRKGTARMADLQSLIGWSNRFKGETSALFARPNMAAPTLTCVADYHAGGTCNTVNIYGDPTARHCHHRAIYTFPLSAEWEAWTGISGISLGKDDLGEFIEAQAKDIMDPTPAVLNGVEADKNQPWENRLIQTARQIEGRYGQLTQLLAISKKFQIYETSDLKVSTNRDTGEAEIQFLNEHKGADGKPLNIPNLLIIAIPVFMGGAPYRMPVRFRYRKQGGKVLFVLSVYNPEKAFEAAFKEAVIEATEATGLPIFMGADEANDVQ